MTRLIVLLVAALIAGGGLLIGSASHAVRSIERVPVQADSRLADQLGCAACHTGLGSAASIRDRAPSLAAAGARYRASYLFEYLLAPRRVRPHIGPARMPGFHLDEREALALTLFLMSREFDELPAPPVERGGGDGEALIHGELGCLACHTLGGRGAALAPSLDAVGARVTEAFLIRFLADPTAFDSANVMPALFVERTDSAWRPRTSNPAGKLGAVVEYLLDTAGEERRRATRRFEAVRAANPDVTQAVGAEIARALNCGGCHRGLPAATRPTAPSLANAVRQVRPEWLRSYLHAPTPIRPAGFRPGDGSRMPDFGLTDEEVDALARFLNATSAPPPPTRPLTPFQRSKARAFVRERLPCLGCHRLNGEGGRIGPDLTGVGARFTPAAIRAMMTTPQDVAPGSIMPQHPMPDAQIDLIAGLLAEQTVADTAAGYLSLIDYPPSPQPSAPETGRDLYRAYCAHCHGNSGGGDGWNRAFLPVQPTQHADSAYMARRPDDVLYDGIHAGGYILNRSHRMPAFGQRLTDPEIRAIVAYMRELCNCQGPAWSRDGRRD